MPERCAIALGSNLDPERHMPRALARLLDQPELRLLAESKVYRTPPAMGAVGPSYWNAALLLETGLEPEALRDRLLRPIEAALGRRRSADKNAARTLDLDIAIFEQRVMRSAEGYTRIPDPDLLRWPHVALPLADVWPGWRHPIEGCSLEEIAAGMREGFAGLAVARALSVLI